MHLSIFCGNHVEQWEDENKYKIGFIQRCLNWKKYINSCKSMRALAHAFKQWRKQELSWDSCSSLLPYKAATSVIWDVHSFCHSKTFLESFGVSLRLVFFSTMQQKVEKSLISLTQYHLQSLRFLFPLWICTTAGGKGILSSGHLNLVSDPPPGCQSSLRLAFKLYQSHSSSLKSS